MDRTGAVRPAPPENRMSTISHLVNTTIGRIAALPLLSTALLLVVTGCADIKPYVPPSEGHISKPAAKPGPEKAIPPPARTSTFVPPPKPVVKPQTYSVVVNEVPVKELLLALARDTKQNIDIHPGLTGLVSLNAINETLPAILDRVSKQVNMRYRMEGNTIIVSPDAAYIQTYRVNYVNMTRNTTSNVGVSGQISGGTTTGTGTSGAGSSAAGTGASSTTVETKVKNEFWDSLRKDILAILTATYADSLTADQRAQRAEIMKEERTLRLKEADTASRAGQGAAPLFNSAFKDVQSSPITDFSSRVIINNETGTVSVLATERQHRAVQQHIDSISAAAQRQVLIEATIVEVSLSEAYQGGIDWSRLELGKVGWTVSQALLGGFNPAAIAAGAAAGNAVTIGYQNTNDPNRSINLTIKLLQEFGNTKVLSSPKLMALNNQTALLKVVDNIVYFEIKADTTTSTNTSLTTFNTIAKTVSVGVVMGVTPQINDDGRVTLSVRPTISRVIRFKNDPNPSLCDAARTNCISSPVPEVQTREMESVLQVGSGQTVILGGLMQDEVQRNREQVPGADKVQQPLLGEALRFRDERAAKSELIIFLRPTVVTNPSLASEELKFFERFLPQPETPPAKAGTTR